MRIEVNVLTGELKEYEDAPAVETPVEAPVEPIPVEGV